MFDGIINVYKEQGYTSFDVVAKLRGILKQKKIGHTGTLDPMAEGVLIVCLGKATKISEMLIASDKEYAATMQLGISTDTEDITGNVLSTKPYDKLTKDMVLEAVESFVGEYNQLPPMYSAIKKDGKKLYEYARAGITVEREKRPVNIYEIKDIKIDMPYVSFVVRCSKGTYIRSLCRDIGEKLSCGACMTKLVRNNLHGMDVKDSLKLADIERFRDEEKLDEIILPMDKILYDYPAYEINNEYIKYLQNGNKLKLDYIKCIDDRKNLSDKDIIRIYQGDNLAALYEYIESEAMIKPYKMLLS